MRIDVWSDVVCPWCYIGKRRLESALARYEDAAGVEVRWHSFQLDPAHPAGLREPTAAMLARKMGAGPEQVREMQQRVTELAAAEGLRYDLDRSISVNTLDAHRLLQFADREGLGGAAHERLLAAHLCEGETVDDIETLVRLGVEAGLAETETRRVLESGAYADEVAADVAEARRIGVSGVPFFVLDGAYGVSGAQPVDTFLHALRTAGAARGRV
ncbi:DsbA family oxidoreductase [Streptomyces sp. XM4011]|uniref:DsbA family oxidoreductase n=1 Tax=Streptomyces sp. XM4011 TaxID=2929780 RepID=UPI001FFBC512|nr:DsbA family oxidoreductase [Streptomyces sp. XM4011]MCK1817558.1 DsbA family oxidoreductase [Streptomyces sp. XM4011]